jgi:AcrR family transcriptional regulator
MTVTSGKRLDPAARRAQLIALGLEFLRTNPGELQAVDRIAEAAGISRGLLFHYFPTKRAYHVAVVRAAADLLLHVTDPDPKLDALARLHAGLDSYISFVEENSALYTSLLRGAAGGDDELQSIFDETREKLVHRVVDGLGLIDPSPLMRSALRGWVGSVEEATLDYLRNGDVDRAALVTLLERTLVRSVEIATELDA